MIACCEKTVTHRKPRVAPPARRRCSRVRLCGLRVAVGGRRVRPDSPLRGRVRHANARAQLEARQVRRQLRNTKQRVSESGIKAPWGGSNAPAVRRRRRHLPAACLVRRRRGARGAETRRKARARRCSAARCTAAAAARLRPRRGRASVAPRDAPLRESGAGTHRRLRAAAAARRWSPGPVRAVRASAPRRARLNAQGAEGAERRAAARACRNVYTSAPSSRSTLRPSSAAVRQPGAPDAALRQRRSA